MQRWRIDQLIDMCNKHGYEVILNDGEVIGIEKLAVNIVHRSFNYFVFTEKPKYTSSKPNGSPRGSGLLEAPEYMLRAYRDNGQRTVYP